MERDDGARELRYVQDLLGDAFNVQNLDADVGDLNDPEAQGARVDVRKKDELFVTEMSEASNYGGGGDLADLTRWTLSKVGRYDELADRELRQYIDRVLQALSEEYSPEELHRAKYQIRDRIQRKLDAHYLSWAKRSYEELKKEGGLTADPGVAYRLPEELELPTSQCTVSFRKSVFEYPGKLNAEEQEFAGKLDTLDNVAFWYRNPDKNGFALQGYRRTRFNPDFIAFTGSGRVAVLEYKGEDRESNEDTRYKESLGDGWAALDPERRFFRVVTKSNMQGVLKEVEAL